jgi:hypothetical protein
MQDFGDKIAVAVSVILEGVKNKTWRMIIGTDTESLDVLVRESPETVYEPRFQDIMRRLRVVNRTG